MFGRRRQHARGQAAEKVRTLAGLRPGQHATIQEIEDSVARAQAVRFGMGAGARVSCVTAVPGGPVVLKSGRQEIAVGRGLARRIQVQHAEACHGRA